MRAIFLVCLLVMSAQAMTYDEQFIRSLKNSEFGKTILQTIQLEMGGEGSSVSDRVLGLLQQMQSDVSLEQKDEDAQIANRQTECDTKISDVAGVVKTNAERKADEERQVPLLQEEQQDKIKQVEDKNGQDQRNVDRLQSLNDQRKETRTQYEERRDELVGLIETLQEAKQIISQLHTGSFLQVNDPILVQMKQHQKKFLKNYPNQRGFHALVNVMLEAVSDAKLSSTKEGASKVVEVIQNLVDSIYEVQKQELLADDKRQQEYQISRSRLDLENRRLLETVAFLKAKVEIISQKLLELQNNIASYGSIVDTKSQERADWDKTCKDDQHGHELKTKNRSEQLEILNQCIEIFQNRFNNDIGSFIQNIRVD